MLSGSSDKMTDRAVKRYKEEHPDLVRPTNRDQYIHNFSLKRVIDRASSAAMSGDIEHCISSLSEGKRLIKERQRLIRIADAEPHGWNFVFEYQKESLANDSDDEKALARARRTLKNREDAKKRESERNLSRSTSNNQRSSYRERSPIRVRPSNDRRDIPHNETRLVRYNGGSNLTSENHRVDFRTNRYDRHCFLCGQRGHMHFDCRKRR